ARRARRGAPDLLPRWRRPVRPPLFRRRSAPLPAQPHATKRLRETSYEVVLHNGAVRRLSLANDGISAKVRLAPLLQLRKRGGSAKVPNSAELSEVVSGGPTPHPLFLSGESPAPPHLKSGWWEGPGLSLAVPAVVLGLLIYAASHVKDVVKPAN